MSSKSGSLKIGDLVSRCEAPTMLYRVTSIRGKAKTGFVVILPYRWRGEERVIMWHGRKWVGDGSIWEAVT